MGHFAKVVDGKVTQVIVAEPDFFNTFVDSSPGQWIQTSYNTYGNVHYAPSPPAPPRTPDGGEPLRGNYATIGCTYDLTNDVFYLPQPYPSWILNEDTCIWEAPIPWPQPHGFYSWNEDQRRWDLLIDGYRAAYGCDPEA